MRRASIKYMILGSFCLLPLSEGSARAQATAAQVCQRWVCDRADLSEGVSTGDIASCDAGDLQPPGRPNSLKLVNLYRFLAGMPAVTEDPTWDTQAQECALIQAANGLSHTPSTSDKCYTPTGATASSQSSVCDGQSVSCIDLYMNDGNGGPGFGHRRWIFANSLGPVGFGSVGGGGRSMTASCFRQVGGTVNAGKAYVAWPPPGPVPLAAITTTGVDKAGWSVQSDTISMTSATATVTDGTTSMPVTVTPGLQAGYGSMFAMEILPNGWTSQAGHNYTVTLGGTPTPVTYTVQVVDCSGTTTSGCPASDAGASGASDAAVAPHDAGVAVDATTTGGSSGSSGGGVHGSEAGSSNGSRGSSGAGSNGGGSASGGQGAMAAADAGSSSQADNGAGSSSGAFGSPAAGSGCGCRVPGAAHPKVGAEEVLGLAMAAAFLRRRRRTRASRAEPARTV